MKSRWWVKALVAAASIAVAFGAMAAAAAWLRPEPPPCTDMRTVKVDAVPGVSPTSVTACAMPETSPVVVFSAGAAGATAVLASAFVVRRSQSR